MTTPMFRQYQEIKKELKDEILFFRMGDFYEMFYDDAERAARILGIALTSRSNGKQPVPMAGVPCHSANTYLKRLIQAGCKVAVCEQVEDPKLAKGLVKRELVRIVTPGTLVEEDLLDEKKSNYLLALTMDNKRAALAWMDISTGEFVAAEVEKSKVMDEISKIQPAEVILPEKLYRDPQNPFRSRLEAILSKERITSLEDWHFDEKEGARKVKKVLKAASLRGYGIGEDEPILKPVSALLEYVETTQKQILSHIRPLQKLNIQEFMEIDTVTQRTLELLETMGGGDRQNTLVGILDKTQTAMGGRLLRQWILHPLLDVGKIRLRQEAVEELCQNHELRKQVREGLYSVFDLERLGSKISTGRVTPRDLVSLRTSLAQLPPILEVLEGAQSSLLQSLFQSIDPLEDMADLLQKAISDNPPIHIQDGGVIREGFHSKLDELRSLSQKGQGWLQKYQEEESQKWEIPTLKVGFNQVFGYYIEVTHAHGHKVPEHYIRKQTLKNAERYITPELKEYEEKVLTAQDEALAIEAEIFQNIRETLASQSHRLFQTAQALAQLDVLQSLSQAAYEYGYHRPEVVDEFVIQIKNGRHPVLERVLETSFVANDLEMNPKEHLLLITGPNMAGKSTYIRQAGLIVLMAQMGSFVPAESARIGVVDRIFTRLGSTDELYMGYSTFMIEMLETANILNNATRKSLVLLDEVGRGTSTYDGVSLAWALSEYLHDEIGCRTLFATHYHELTQLPRQFSRMKNLSVAIREWEKEITFLHKIQEGPTKRSYGIHVAQLAGMPPKVIQRAEEILQELETASPEEEKKEKTSFKSSSQNRSSMPIQLPLFQELKKESKVMKKLRNLSLENLTPLEALLKLKELQDLANS